MNYTFHIDSDQLSAQIAERLDHDAIAESIDLSELVDNLPMSTLAEHVAERIAYGEIADAIDLGELAEAVYPLIINDEESLSNRIEVLEAKAEEDDRRINDLIDRIRLLEASVTVFVPMPDPVHDEVIDLEEFNQPEVFEMVTLSMPHWVYERIMDGIRKHSILTDLDARELATYLQASRADAYK